MADLPAVSGAGRIAIDLTAVLIDPVAGLVVVSLDVHLATVVVVVVLAATGTNGGR